MLRPQLQPRELQPGWQLAGWRVAATTACVRVLIDEQRISPPVLRAVESTSFSLGHLLSEFFSWTNFFRVFFLDIFFYDDVD